MEKWHNEAILEVIHEIDSFASHSQEITSSFEIDMKHVLFQQFDNL